jgi:hypothetical protein
MLSDLRFVIGAILATAVLAVSSFALYATVKVMQQAKQGVIASSRTPAFDPGADWHRPPSNAVKPVPGSDDPPADSVSVILNALPSSTPTPAEALPPAERAAAAPAAPVEPMADAVSGDEPAWENNSPRPAEETVTGTLAPQPLVEATPPVPEAAPTPDALRKPASAAPPRKAPGRGRSRASAKTSRTSRRHDGVPSRSNIARARMCASPVRTITSAARFMAAITGSHSDIRSETGAWRCR